MFKLPELLGPSYWSSDSFRSKLSFSKAYNALFSRDTLAGWFFEHFQRKCGKSAKRLHSNRTLVVNRTLIVTFVISVLEVKFLSSVLFLFLISCALIKDKNQRSCDFLILGFNSQLISKGTFLKSIALTELNETERPNITGQRTGQERFLVFLKSTEIVCSVTS